MKIPDGIDNSTQNHKGKIVYLHGILNNEESIDDLVFGAISFKKAYNQSLLSHMLITYLCFNDILCYGFNVFENEFFQIVEKADSILGNRNRIRKDQQISRRIFLLLTEGKKSDSMLIFEESAKRKLMNIELIDINFKEWTEIDKWIFSARENGPSEIKTPELTSGFDRKKT